MNEAPALLAVAELSRHYDGGSVKALDGVSFEAHAGEVLALTGPSGCGKSTLLSLIGLLDQPSFGRVCIAGQELATVRQAGNFRLKHIGFVFQFHHMVATMTLLENVEAPLVALGLPRAERRARASEMLAQMDLSARPTSCPPRSQAGSASARPWRAPSSTSRRCCSPTSPLATSTATTTPSWLSC